MCSAVLPSARGPILPPGGSFPSAPGHPKSKVLRRFVANRASRPERRAVVLHLLKGCTVCSKALVRCAALEPTQVPPKAYDGAIDRCHKRLDGLLVKALAGKERAC